MKPKKKDLPVIRSSKSWSAMWDDEFDYPLHMSFNSKSKAEDLIENWNKHGGLDASLKPVAVRIIPERDYRLLRKLLKGKARFSDSGKVEERHEAKYRSNR